MERSTKMGEQTTHTIHCLNRHCMKKKAENCKLQSAKQLILLNSASLDLQLVLSFGEKSGRPWL